MGNVLRTAAEFFHVAVEWLKKEFVAFFKEFAKQLTTELCGVQQEISVVF